MEVEFELVLTLNVSIFYLQGIILPHIVLSDCLFLTLFLAFFTLRKLKWLLFMTIMISLLRIFFSFIFVVFYLQ